MQAPQLQAIDSSFPSKWATVLAQTCPFALISMFREGEKEGKVRDVLPLHWDY